MQLHVTASWQTPFCLLLPAVPGLRTMLSRTGFMHEHMHGHRHPSDS